MNRQRKRRDSGTARESTTRSVASEIPPYRKLYTEGLFTRDPLTRAYVEPRYERIGVFCGVVERQ